MVPSVECGCGGGMEGGEMPQVQDVQHCPFELDVLLVGAFRKFSEIPHLLRTCEKGLSLRPFSGEGADVLLQC